MHKASLKEHGNAFIELAVILPLLLFTFFGMLEIGRLIAQYLWLQQTAYNAAIGGGGVVDEHPQSAMARISTELWGYQNKDMQSEVLSPKFNTASPTLEMEISADLNMITNSASLSISQKAVAGNPYYTAFAMDALGKFENPPGEFDCGFNPCQGCSPTSCGGP